MFFVGLIKHKICLFYINIYIFIKRVRNRKTNFTENNKEKFLQTYIEHTWKPVCSWPAELCCWRCRGIRPCRPQLLEEWSAGCPHSVHLKSWKVMFYKKTHSYLESWIIHTKLITLYRHKTTPDKVHSDYWETISWRKYIQQDL